MDSKIIKHIEYLTNSIILECKSPTCISYEYDPTPTGEERLKNVLSIANQIKRHINGKNLKN